MKRQTVFPWIVVFVLFALLLARPSGVDCVNGACRPKRSIVSRVVDWAAWLRLAPIRQEEPLPPSRMASTNRTPIRAMGPDGELQIEHGNGW